MHIHFWTLRPRMKSGPVTGTGRGVSEILCHLNLGGQGGPDEPRSCARPLSHGLNVPFAPSEYVSFSHESALAYRPVGRVPTSDGHFFSLFRAPDAGNPHSEQAVVCLRTHH
jgi:hypothetical protein